MESSKELKKEKTYFTISLLGMDKPGVFSKVSQVVKNHNGNVELQKGSTMAGDFAILMYVSMQNVDSESVTKFIDEMHSLRGDDFIINARKASPASFELSEGMKWGQISVNGKDQVGIVEKVTRLLSEHNVNFKTMESGIIQAPLSGVPLFEMSGKVITPKNIDIDKLKKQLSEIEQEMNLTISFQVPVDK